MDIVVVGHLSRDLLVTPETAREALGGGTAYAMLAPSLGISKCGIVSCVGDDFDEDVGPFDWDAVDWDGGCGGI